MLQTTLSVPVATVGQGWKPEITHTHGDKCWLRPFRPKAPTKPAARYHAWQLWRNGHTALASYDMPTRPRVMSVLCNECALLYVGATSVVSGNAGTRQQKCVTTRRSRSQTTELANGSKRAHRRCRELARPDTTRTAHAPAGSLYKRGRGHEGN